MTALPRPGIRVDLDPDDLARGFSQVVLVVADLLHELLERQAIRRIECGDLSDRQIERLGTSLRRIAEQIAEIRTALAAPTTRKDSP